MPALNVNDYLVKWLQTQLGSAGVSDGVSQLQVSSGNVANANAVATLTGAAGKFTYIQGFTATAAGSTAGLAVTLTVVGPTNTLSYTFTFPIGPLVSAQPLTVNFSPAVPSSAANTNIVVTLPAGGAGNTNASVTAWGYLL